MQAAVLNKFNDPLEIKQVDIPRPGPDDVLIKMIACGVCHTDLHFIRGGMVGKHVSSFFDAMILFSFKNGKCFDHSCLGYRVMKALER